MDDQPNPRMIMRGGMMLPEDMVRSNTPFIPSREQQNQTTTSPNVGVKPLSQRMSAAYDRMKSNEKESKKISSKDTVMLGKLVLEIEQVKNNLKSIENEFRSTFRKKAELDQQENELLEEEKDRLTALGASFRGFRRRLGAITALLAGKQFLEGDLQGGFQNTAIAVTSFLPEIIKVVSAVVLGKMLLGGRGMGAVRGVSSGSRGGLLPLLLGGGGLLAAGTALGARGSGDQRRLELTRRQAIPQLLSRNDVRRFRASSTRFDNILTGMDDKKDLEINPRTAVEVGDEIKEPKGFIDTAKDFGGNVMNFFKGENNPVEEPTEEKTEEETNLQVSGNRDNRPEMIGGVDIAEEFVDIFGPNALLKLPSLEEIDLSLAMSDDEEEGGGENDNNIFTLESEDKQVSNNVDNPPSTSNVHVKSTFSDNSKISYILEYGGGAVIG